MTELNLAALKAALEAERVRVAADIVDFEEQGQETLSDVSGENNYRDHMADQGTATFAREMDMTLEVNARDALAQIDQALARIADGTYGVCVRCGAPIAAERLEAMPETDLCLSCKAREESE